MLATGAAAAARRSHLISIFFRISRKFAQNATGRQKEFNQRFVAYATWNRSQTREDFGGFERRLRERLWNFGAGEDRFDAAEDISLRGPGFFVEFA